MPRHIGRKWYRRFRQGDAVLFEAAPLRRPDRDARPAGRTRRHRQAISRPQEVIRTETRRRGHGQHRQVQLRRIVAAGGHGTVQAAFPPRGDPRNTGPQAFALRSRQGRLPRDRDPLGHIRFPEQRTRGRHTTPLISPRNQQGLGVHRGAPLRDHSSPLGPRPRADPRGRLLVLHTGRTVLWDHPGRGTLPPCHQHAILEGGQVRAKAPRAQSSQGTRRHRPGRKFPDLVVPAPPGREVWGCLQALPRTGPPQGERRELVSERQTLGGLGDARRGGIPELDPRAAIPDDEPPYTREEGPSLPYQYHRRDLRAVHQGHTRSNQGSRAGQHDPPGRGVPQATSRGRRRVLVPGLLLGDRNARMAATLRKRGARRQRGRYNDRPRVAQP